MILPKKYDMIPLSVYRKLCSEFDASKLFFEAKISHEFRLNLWVSEERLSFALFMADARAYLSFPYIQVDDEDSHEHFKSQASSRLFQTLEILDKGKEGYASKYIASEITSSFKALQKMEENLLSYDDVIDKDPVLKQELEPAPKVLGPLAKELHRGTKLIGLGEKLDPSSDYIEEEFTKIGSPKHHYLFLKKLGIVDYLNENWGIQNDPMQTTDLKHCKPEFSKLLAKICKYDSSDQLHQVLRDEAKDEEKYLNPTANKAVTKILADLGIQQKKIQKI